MGAAEGGLNDSGRTTLKDSVLHSWFLDPAVTGLGTPNPANEEQLLIHPTGTSTTTDHGRPRRSPTSSCPATTWPDLDLATMEGANTSARRPSTPCWTDSSAAERCEVHQLYRPPEMEPLKRVDELRYRLGLPNTFDLG